MRHKKIPEGWELVTTEFGEDPAWDLAVKLKTERERLRPDLFIRTKAVPSGVGGYWWVLRKEEPRQERVI